MHKKYSDVVPLGPNMVSVNSPRAIPMIYRMRAGIPKCNFYTALRAYSHKGDAVKLVFNTQDEDTLKSIKNPIVPLFSQSSIAKYEPMVDDILP
ncbi:hypothetical protein F5B22DRAFT_264490 [Xylaria bambusicola]|uniref:uncharacterized protein n=1 Tax=Xylaria bambusicola TaxID=326684 RepID=UPI002007200C|nr:uncharacterized protein F5B22DRAFT_264490 [Xylaria bambusicola]KAI0526010.1 hypothetical protein F5B22DRAFT_264490 [Xylaria bambusicola]